MIEQRIMKITVPGSVAMRETIVFVLLLPALECETATAVKYRTKRK